MLFLNIRAGYGGFKCGPRCNSKHSNESQTTIAKTLTPTFLCPVLCDYDLGKVKQWNSLPNSVWYQMKKFFMWIWIVFFFDSGGRECECKPSPYSVKNTAGICNKLCESWNIKLNGCSECGKNETKKSTVLPTTETPSTPTPTTEKTNQESSTPDWKEVCSDLCKNGLGGVLCNCDLSPIRSNDN